MNRRTPPYQMTEPSYQRKQATELTISNKLFRAVYNWMAVGLLVSTAAAYLIISSPAVLQIVASNRWFIIAVALAQIGIVFFLSARITSLSAQTAGLFFIVYSALNGLFLSLIVLAYTPESIVKTLVTAASMFIVMSIYGTTTKRDLTSLRSFCFMGLIGVLIAMVVNIFWANSMMSFIISCVGVIVFLGLTAYDTQKIKELAAESNLKEDEPLQRIAILGALTLYLDFINLFIMLLRLMGERR